MTYFLIKLTHISCSTILMWTGIASVLAMFLANRFGDRDAIHQVARYVLIADLAITTPALVLQLATGMLLLNLAQFDPTQMWLFLGITLYVLASFCWVPTVGLQMQMRRLAAQAVDKDEPLGPGYSAVEKRWSLFACLTFVMLACVFYFMIYKPLGL